MNPNTLLFSLLSVLTILSACTPTPPPTATITGQLLEADSQLVFLIHADQRYSYREWLEAVDSVQLDSVGLFQFTFQAETPDYYQVCDQRGVSLFPNLYMAGGDSLHLVRNVKDYKVPVKYSGTRAEAYSFFNLRDSLRSNDPLFKMPYYDTYKLEPDSFRTLMESRFVWENQLRDQFFQAHPDWAPVQVLAQAQASYNNGEHYFDYLEYHNYYVNDTFLYFQVDSSFYGFLKEVDQNPEAFYFLPEYKAFMGVYLNDLLQRAYSDLTDSARWAQKIPLKLDLVQKHLNGVARDAALLAMSDDFSFDMEGDDFWQEVETLDAYFRENHTDELSYRKFSHVLAKFQALRPGQPAPDFAFPDVHGDTVHLSDFRGNVVYIDCWGTWCYPCLEELPHSLKLMEKLEGEEVVFVYIGLESIGQIQEWSEFVQGKRSFPYAPFLEQRVYPGVHLLSEGQFMNPGLRPYLINFAPTYMLIDREGRIVNARASRPSDEETEGKIRAVLEY